MSVRGARCVLLAAILASWNGGHALAQQAIPTDPSLVPAGDSNTEDREFLAQAVQAGIAKTRLAELALEKSRDDDVRAYAERLVRDHAEAGRQLSLIAYLADMPPIEELGVTHERLYTRLSQLSGDEFDRQYMQSQVEAYRLAVSLFSDEASERPVGGVERLAADMLPILQEHLEMAEAIARSMI